MAGLLVSNAGEADVRRRHGITGEFRLRVSEAGEAGGHGRRGERAPVDWRFATTTPFLYGKVYITALAITTDFHQRPVNARKRPQGTTCAAQVSG